MDQRRGWLRQDGWWRKEEWTFQLKFTEKTEKSFYDKNLSALRLQDVVQYVTHVQTSQELVSGIGITTFFDAMELSKPSLLESIDLGHYCITDADVESLARGIEFGCLQSLKCLKIFGGIKHHQLKNKGLVTLTDSCQGGALSLLPNLSSLDLTRNSITEVGMLSLAKVLSSGKLPNLGCLNMKDNQIGHEGAKSLGRAIRSGELKNLDAIDLTWCEIGDKGLIALADSIQGGAVSLLPDLRYLDLSSNSLTDVGMSSLAEVLSSRTLPNLEYLELGNNKIGNEGAKSLGLAIRSGELKNLAGINLTWCDIGDEGLIALADSIQGGTVSLLPNLRSLDLSSNSLTDVGMSSLAEVLSSRTLPNLEYLELGNNKIGNEGAKSLGLAIRSGELKNLARVDLWACHIGDEGLIALADSFQEGLLPNLSCVYLRGNTFTKVGLLSLAEALKSGRLNTLEVLDVTSSKITKEGASALVSALSSNICLTVNVRLQWDAFPELDLRRKHIERTFRKRRILAGLETVPKVQATFGKVYLCGNPEVGKTTLRRSLQRDFWEAKTTWERRPHVEKRTRGIGISQLSSKSAKPDANPIMLHVWDMAGQEDFHLVHNAFFPDLGFAEGRATIFVIVCSSKYPLQNSIEQLEYWLRYVASSCDKTSQNFRHVFVVMNNIGGSQTIHSEHWKQVLDDQRDKFKQRLKIQTDLFLVDVRRFQEVEDLKSRLFEHSRNSLSNQKVPSICQAIRRI